MAEHTSPPPVADAWTEEQWNALESLLSARVRRSRDDDQAWGLIVRSGRTILRSFSTSFFIVTRFLPPRARDGVEAIYAAVRYPDEIVDTFAIAAHEKIARLDRWGQLYEMALPIASVREAVDLGIPPILAGFARVVQRAGIPAGHYRSFLDAMRRDAEPRPFATLDELIENYVYGSAIVVGYFLAYVYGPSRPGEFDRTLRSARDLAIALQLTNFARDVADDQRRGRLYLPLSMLAEERIDVPDINDPRQHEQLGRVVARISASAEEHYARAHAGLESFAPDCRVAIDSCIRVYRQLNERIGAQPAGIARRESVPMSAKLRVLPPSKYWRLPLAYLTP
ncbi:MAG TPA: phytoene/squalene synthase family protein [Candidatus Kapabacteria bacterium]|nr:phytoene/squalene synthase family protein [Candidatus Kapabacteria bacterium]